MEPCYLSWLVWNKIFQQHMVQLWQQPDVNWNKYFISRQAKHWDGFEFICEKHNDEGRLPHVIQSFFLLSQRLCSFSTIVLCTNKHAMPRVFQINRKAFMNKNVFALFLNCNGMQKLIRRHAPDHIWLQPFSFHVLENPKNKWEGKKRDIHPHREKRSSTALISFSPEDQFCNDFLNDSNTQKFYRRLAIAFLCLKCCITTALLIMILWCNILPEWRMAHQHFSLCHTTPAME